MTPQFRIRKKEGRYRVERFIGYTDGRPSWGQETLVRFGTRAEASTFIAERKKRVLAGVPPERP